MKLFNHLSLCEHPSGVRLAIAKRITPVPERAAVLEQQLGEAREYIKRREAKEHMTLREIIDYLCAITPYHVGVKHIEKETYDQVQPRQH